MMKWRNIKFTKETRTEKWRTKWNDRERERTKKKDMIDDSSKLKYGRMHFKFMIKLWSKKSILHLLVTLSVLSFMLCFHTCKCISVYLDQLKFCQIYCKSLAYCKQHVRPWKIKLLNNLPLRCQYQAPWWLWETVLQTPHSVQTDQHHPSSSLLSQAMEWKEQKQKN